MEIGGGSGTNRSLTVREGKVLCFCGLPAKISKAWTERNPGRRFYGCERYKRGGECKFFKWFDEGEAFGWQKEALIEARDEIREKNQIIEQLKKIISELQNDLERKKEDEEDIINSFLKL